jgi:lipopolysaccharide export system permease protein
VRDVEEMRIAEAREWIRGLETSGLPFRAPLTDFYERFSFAFTPLVVALIASGVGGRFKKNILLYSLLIALGLSVAYYVTQMISGILAGLGYIAPALGAWLGVGLFAAAGILLLRHART